MAAKLATPEAVPQQPPAFPPSNWGARAAVLGVFLALFIGIFLSVPVILIDNPGEGADLSSTASVAAQLATVFGFIAVPFWIARRRGAATFGEALARLGVRGFRPLTALKWGALAIFSYLVFAAFYAGIFGAPEQEDIAESFGTVPVQILLIVIGASISEEICFRGMLFGGLRERFPAVAAALLSAGVFGILHALTGISAVPPLIAFGFVLALLYEKTGSIVPGIVIHMLNNSVALLAQ